MYRLRFRVLAPHRPRGTPMLRRFSAYAYITVIPAVTVGGIKRHTRGDLRDRNSRSASVSE